LAYFLLIKIGNMKLQQTILAAIITLKENDHGVCIRKKVKKMQSAPLSREKHPRVPGKLKIMRKKRMLLPVCDRGCFPF
jgi:hypothetical protein